MYCIPEDWGYINQNAKGMKMHDVKEQIRHEQF